MAQMQCACANDGEWPACSDSCDDDETALAEDDQDDDESPLDGAEDALDAPEGNDASLHGDGLHDDTAHRGDEEAHLGAPQAGAGGGWEIILAERDAAGEWFTAGEPVPDVDFAEQGLAYDFAENRNKREFGRGFDWANDPSRAWVVVRPGQFGRLRRNARTVSE